MIKSKDVEENMENAERYKIKLRERERMKEVSELIIILLDEMMDGGNEFD